MIRSRPATNHPGAIAPLLACLSLLACGSREPEAVGSGSGAPTGSGAGTTSAAATGGAGTGTGGAGTGAVGSSTSSGAGTGGGPMGMPITAPDDTWTWIPFPNALCRDGSTTGLGVNLHAASKKIVIFLQGGGSCYSAASCATNPSHYGKAEFSGPTTGIFDRTNATNPVKDWNMVFVPYCTGDMHVGNAPDRSVPGVAQPQQFMGYGDMAAFLQRIVPTVPGADQVLLTGSSAGGIGAVGTYLQVQAAFGGTKVFLLDDSGPVLGPALEPPCFQTGLRALWNLDTTVLAACGSACPDPTDYLLPYLEHATQTHSSSTFGLISSIADSTVRKDLGVAQNGCTGTTSVTAAAFATALADLRTQLATSPNFGTFYIGTCGGPAGQCSTHTWLSSPELYTVTAGGMILADWAAKLVAGTVTNQGP
jgi:hypothetical protein